MRGSAPKKNYNSQKPLHGGRGRGSQGSVQLSRVEPTLAGGLALHGHLGLPGVGRRVEVGSKWGALLLHPLGSGEGAEPGSWGWGAAGLSSAWRGASGGAMGGTPG